MRGFFVKNTRAPSIVIVSDANKRFVSVREAAKALGISATTLYRLIWAGKITKSVIRTPTGRYRIDLDELLEELKEWSEYLSRHARALTGGDGA